MRFLIAFIIVLCFTSCFSTQYTVKKDQDNFYKIHAGNKYTIFDKNDRKIPLNVTSLEKDSIRGNEKNRSFAIAKNDIKMIRRNKTAGTVLIVGGAFAGVTIITALVNVLKDNSEAFGSSY